MDKPKTREEAEKACAFWGVNDPEEVYVSDAEEAIEEYLESIAPDLPETITLQGFARVPVAYNYSRGPLELMLEQLSEEYGDPDGDDYVKPTPAMLVAEKAFVAAVLAEYKPWACEVVYTEEINVAGWVSKNRPEWLEESK